MKAIELTANIDREHQLKAVVPSDVPEGPVRVLVLLPEEEEAGALCQAALPKSGRQNWRIRAKIFTR